MKRIASCILTLQLMPMFWLIAWMFAPGPTWTWQWVPGILSQAIFYAVSLYAAYIGIKGLRRPRK